MVWSFLTVLVILLARFVLRTPVTSNDGEIGRKCAFSSSNTSDGLFFVVCIMNSAVSCSAQPIPSLFIPCIDRSKDPMFGKVMFDKSYDVFDFSLSIQVSNYTPQPIYSFLNNR